MAALGASAKAVKNEAIQCHRLRITYTGDGKGDGLIAVKHISTGNKVLSECVFSPDEAYEYAQAILKAYDAVTED